MNSLQLAPTDLYLPLHEGGKEIRLLILSPSSTHGGAINCRLRRASLESSLALPQYDAISYCWGNEADRACIMVNSQPFHVPSSAKAALERMKLRDEERVLWIDAVCINQIDKREKSWQVAMMGEIYRRAMTVLIQFGSLPDERQCIHQVAQDLSRVFGKIKTALNHLPVEDRDPHAWSTSIPSSWEGNDILSDDDMNALEPLFRAPWLRRLWTVQEAALGLERQCFLANARGTDSIQFPLWLLLIAANIRAHASVSPRLPPGFSIKARMGFHAALIMWTHMFRVSFRPFATLRLLCDTHQTTDSRDKVFALVELYIWHAGLLRIPDLIKPDYTRSEALVYRDASRFMLMEDGGKWGHELLAGIFHGHGDLGQRDRPSWTLDFNQSDTLGATWLPLENFRAGFRPPEPAGSHAGLMPRPYNVDRPAALQIQAFTVGVVVEVYDVVTREDLNHLADLRRLLREVEAAVRRFVQHARAVHPQWALRHIAETLSCLSGPEMSARQRLRSYRDFRRCVLEKGAIPRHRWTPWLTLAGDVSTEERYASQFGALMRMLMHRRLAVCSSGHVGFLPMIARVGDLCVVAVGAQHPFILRKYPDGYRFVGAAYVQELMHGQVYAMGLESKPMTIL